MQFLLYSVKKSCILFKQKAVVADQFLCISVAIPTMGSSPYSMFQASAAKLIEDGKIHGMEHMINPMTVQADAVSAATAAAVIPSVSTPPPFQVSVIIVKVYNANMLLHVLL